MEIINEETIVLPKKAWEAPEIKSLGLTDTEGKTFNFPGESISTGPS